MVLSAYVSVAELFKCKGISFTNRRNRTGPRIDPCSTPCLTGFGSDVIYALVSQTVVTLLNTIETMPFYLHWHCTLIIFKLFWKNSSYVSGVSICIFVALYVGMFVARANKVEGTMS